MSAEQAKQAAHAAQEQLTIAMWEFQNAGGLAENVSRAVDILICARMEWMMLTLEETVKSRMKDG